MKIKIEMKDFKEMVDKILPSIPKKTYLPILESIFMYTENGKLYMVTTDLETQLKVFKDVNIVENGSCLISSSDLKQIVKLKADTITLEYNQDSKKIIVATDKKTITVVSNQDPIDFPKFDYSDEVERLYTTTESDLLDTLQRLNYYVSNNENNPTMASYCFDFTKNRIVTLDGFRLGIKSINKGIEVNNARQILLNNVIYSKLKKVLKSDTEVTFYAINKLEKDYTIISSNEFELITKNVEGEYYKIDNMLIDKSELNMCTLNVKELEEVAKYNISLLKEKNNSPMILHNTKGRIISYAIGTNGESMDILESEVNECKDDFLIGFNANFLLDLCKSINVEKLEVGFSGEKSPMFAYGNNYTFLILPININNKEEIKNNISKLLNKAA